MSRYEPPIPIQHIWVKKYLSDNTYLDLCKNATEYKNNHKHRNITEIRFHFINIKSQKYAYKHEGNKIARVLVVNL